MTTKKRNTYSTQSKTSHCVQSHVKRKKRTKTQTTNDRCGLLRPCQNEHSESKTIVFLSNALCVLWIYITIYKLQTPFLARSSRKRDLCPASVRATRTCCVQAACKKRTRRASALHDLGKLARRKRYPSPRWLMQSGMVTQGGTHSSHNNGESNNLL